jgi:outer membrane protein OmpA-like peptidoglycan-associated protein
MNQNNPANFERVWRQAYYLYGKIRSIRHRPVSFDRVMDFSIIEKLGKEEKYAAQKDEYTVRFSPKPTFAVRAEEEILTNTVVIHFYPNSWDLHRMVEVDHGSGKVKEMYDPKVDYVLEKIAELAGAFGAARIIIEGHTDSSMKGKVPSDLVKELSMNRANAVKGAVVEKYELDINRFNVEGLGWDTAADEDDPLNHAKNRRVEIKVFRAEAD